MPDGSASRSLDLHVDPRQSENLMQKRSTLLTIALGLLAHSALGDTAASEFLANSERREPTVRRILTWDATAKVQKATMDERDVGFTFRFRNDTGEEIRIKRADSSCGCTVPRLPKLPWVIKPKETGSIPVTMDISGKIGVITKSIILNTDKGIITLRARADIARQFGADVKRSKEERAANLRAAAQNRQAVFHGKCVECHVKPTVGKRGRQLYATACGICHEAKDRASFVPNLRTLASGKDKNYWEQWTTESKPGTLMPAFGKKYGGPLDDKQITTLVAYLTRIYPRELKTRRAIEQKNNPALK